MRLFIRFTRIWILTVPFLLGITGAMSNQLVLVCNKDKFPVMLNERKIEASEPDEAGLIDDTHMVMSNHTHLNYLADWIDLKEFTYSPGDMLIILAEYLTPIAPFIWGLWLLIDKIRE